MSSAPLPAHVDAVRFFARNADMSGTIALERMPRLSEYLLDTEQTAPITAELHFSRTEGGQRLLSGHLAGRFRMRCQRCLEPVAVDLDTRLDLLVARSESELAALASEQDALLCDEEEFDLLGTLEDELILGLPLVPRHDRGDCGQLASRQTEAAGSDPLSGADDAGAEGASAERGAGSSGTGKGPFAELEKLKGMLDKSSPDKGAPAKDPENKAQDPDESG